VIERFEPDAYVLAVHFYLSVSLWPGIAVQRTASLRSPMPGHPRLPST
jgi:hypothetical protein